ncbi:hypothetical protein STRAU_1731 [Streptomyces aurantiacus JA 4570]|uniref:vWA-MoxR associated protein C-terminal domain-containing protein n=1 Tax=Streptomyces aurantiacus JA 4570 TaxID=1286094 RepID=S3ZPK8_9ACTN|nr:hypothetical protein STRAU_1731 [Streptomyces aurantiacus JA 4570]
MLGAARGEVVGSGVYLGEGRVLTCSHVVNEALGRDWFTQDEPAGAQVEVSFPGGDPGAPLVARTGAWIPARRAAPGAAASQPARTGDAIWYGDLAVLQLEGAAPEFSRPVDWAKMARGQQVRAWYAAGQPFTYADGSVQLCDESLGFVDAELRGAAIGPGYSGGPLWCEDHGAAVGIVLGVMEPPPGGFAAAQVIRRTIVLPWQAIHAELHAGTPPTAAAEPAAAPPGERPLAPVDPATRHSLTALVGGLLPDPGTRMAQGRRLADELDLDITEATPSVDEIVEILLTRPRGIATLVEGLPADDRQDAQKLLAFGRAALVPGLLSVREYAWLLDLLTEDLRARLPEAAREALPHTTLFDEPLDPVDSPHERPGPGTAGPATAGDAERLIEALEEYWGDSAPVPDWSPRVPALLRAVEYLAATCTPKQTREFWKWSEQVAHRLGVGREALGERRDDGADWARRRRERTEPPSPRLTVHLTRCSGETYRCTAWYDPGTGSSGTERQVVADDAPRVPAEIARLVHHVLVRETASAAAAAVLPVVEVLLDPEDLDVAVDQWEEEAAPYEVPVVLGAEYALVVRCPEVRNRAPDSLQNWRSRWAAIDRGGLLRIDHRHTTPRQVYGLLKADLAVARVIIDCPPQHRAALRAACLVLGVPVVVWDRQAVPGDQLTALLLNGAVRSLPHRVRQHRARALAEGDRAGVLAPALVWDDASRPPPRALWIDPTVEESAP